MKNISLFLALKYFRSRGKGFVSFHSGMAIFGISIGIAILILVTSVMNGFQRELKERVLETIPHASILGDIQLSEFAALEKTLYKNQEVKGVAPYIETQGLLSSGSYLKGVYFYGIVPEHEKTVSIIHNHILSGSFESLEDEGYNLIIGDILAYQLGLNIGDNVNVLVPDTGLGIAATIQSSKCGPSSRFRRRIRLKMCRRPARTTGRRSSMTASLFLEGTADTARLTTTCISSTLAPRSTGKWTRSFPQHGPSQPSRAQARARVSITA